MVHLEKVGLHSLEFVLYLLLALNSYSQNPSLHFSSVNLSVGVSMKLLVFLGFLMLPILFFLHWELWAER